MAEEGDTVSQEIVDHCLRIWSAATVAQIHAYDPEVVIIGGGVMKSAERILPYIREHVEQNAWTPWGKVQVRVAELGSDAAVLGALPLLEEFHS